MGLLHLNLKSEYFDQIASGNKTEEYRAYNAYWMKRLLYQEYEGIVLKKGYPKRGDMVRTMERCWRSWEIKKITHPHFGQEPVWVFAIKVNP